MQLAYNASTKMIQVKKIKINEKKEMKISKQI